MQHNSCDVLITNATVVIPKIGMVKTNIMIENGKIKALRKSIDNVQASKKINANGKYVLPGVIDPHVHYGVYTPIEEAAQTESRSAAVGGVTTMIRMLRMYESYRNIGNHIKASKGNHHIDYSIHASILNPDQLKDISYLKNIGINSIKIYMNLGADINHIFMDLQPGSHDIIEGQVNMTDEFISSIIEETSKVDSIILVHAENPTVCSEHIRKRKELEEQGKHGLEVTRLKTWSDCRPTSSEVESIAKAANLAKGFGSNLYFVHIGSNSALNAILTEKEKTCSNMYIETCPHYLTHTTDFESLTGKVVPPLRSQEDIQALWSVLAGFPGIATMLPVLLSKGVNEDRLNMERLSEVTSYNTAKIFGMYPKKGTIQPGSDADLTIVDLQLEQKVTPDLLQSYSDYTIYDKWRMQGWPVLTMVRGEVIMQDGQVNSDTLGHGEFINRPNANDDFISN
jgi:dihydropyrimidinase